MLVNGNSSTGSSYTNGFINHEGEIEMASQETHSIAQHRHQTRQRHLSTGQDEDIASSYFASQYGMQQQQQTTTRKTTVCSSSSQMVQETVNTSSRRQDNEVEAVMATAAASIAARKAAMKEKKLQKEMTPENLRRQQQMQQREMTPENLRVVEQKLLQFQQEQMEREHQEQENGHAQGEEMSAMNVQNVSQMQRSQMSVEQLRQVDIQEQKRQQIQMQQQQQLMMQQQQQLQIQQQQKMQMLQQQQIQKEQQQQMQIQQEAQMSNGFHKESSLPPKGQDFSYLALVPPDGNIPHRTQPLEGGPQKGSKKSLSVSGTPDREVKRWSLSSSTDYLGRRGSIQAAPNPGVVFRNNTMGLKEPSVKRDGYAVGNTEGSMYRSTGNLNVAAGSKQGSRSNSEVRDLPPGSWKERRASTSDIKGTGIRVGGNLVQPQAKPQQQSFNMPFGSSGKGMVKRRTTNKQSQSQHSQQMVRSSSTSSSQRTEMHSSSSSSRIEQQTLVHQVGSALAGISSTLDQIQTESSATADSVTVTLPRKSRRCQSLPRGQARQEESSFKVSLPASARTSRQPSVEPSEGRKKLSRHGSVEIFDAAYNLTVPNKASLGRHGSTTKLEQVHADHIKIVPGETDIGTGTGDTEPDMQICPSESGAQSSMQEQNSSVSSKQQLSNSKQLSGSNTQMLSSQEDASVTQMSSSNESTSLKEMSSVQKHASVEKMSSFQQNSSVQQCSNVQQITSFQQNAAIQQSSNVQQTSSTEQCSAVQQSSQYSSSKVENITSSQSYSAQKSSQVRQCSSQQVRGVSSERQRSRQPSGSAQHDVVVQGGGKFNITNGLRRSRQQSTEDISCQRVSHGSQVAGSALKGLDSALEQLAVQQQTNTSSEKTYVAKVSSRQTSRRSSVCQNGDVTTVTVSLPPSQRGSRASSCVREVGGGQGQGRRGSIDIYTAEYAVKVGQGGGIQQKTAFHAKVDDRDIPDNVLHQVEDYNQRREIVEEYGWEPFQHWFHDPTFRSWWQVNGCGGVPLYRVYPRKTEWRTEKPERAPEDPEQSASSLVRNDSVDDMIAKARNGSVGDYNAEARNTKWRTEKTGIASEHTEQSASSLVKDDSVDDLLAKVRALRSRPIPKLEDDDDSGRSTPEHLKNYKADTEIDTAKDSSRKSRTFSDTLKMLDDDILAELDVK